MIAKVVKDNRSYISNVFAIFNQGMNITVITFDDREERYEYLKMYEDGRRKVFILNCNEDLFEEKERIKLNLFSSLKLVKGYPWLIENDDIVRRIIKNQPIDEKYIECAKIANDNILIREWELVENENDVKNLFYAGYNFHDSYISELSYTHEEKRSLKIVFSNCFNATISLMFEGDIKINFTDVNAFDYLIYNASIIFKDEYIYFITNNDIKSVDEINIDDNYFRAKTLKWKIETTY